MPTIHDEEFGEITIRRSSMSRSVRLSVAPNGKLRVSLPTYAPLFLAKRLIASSRESIRHSLLPVSPQEYVSGMQIGKSHHLEIISSKTFKISTHGQQIILSLPDSTTINDTSVQSKLKEIIIKALRREAKSYLPKRLKYLAERHGFSYQKVRFSHASSRWGSCSTNGTISLNIALMKLPFELIDYVLVHELAHTQQMNHSPDFWAIVEAIEPDYKQLRKRIKNETPTIL